MNVNINNADLTEQINELYNLYKNSIKEQFELISEQQNKILLDLDEFYKKSINIILNNKNNKNNKNYKKNLSLNINDNNSLEKHIISKTPKNFNLNYNSNNTLYKSDLMNKTINFKSPSKQNNSVFNNNSIIYSKSKFYSNMNINNHKNDKNIKNKSNFHKKNLLINDKNNKKSIERSISMLLKTNKEYSSKNIKNNSSIISNNKPKNNVINSKNNFNKSNKRKSFEKNNINDKNNINNNNNKISNININDLKKYSLIDIPNEIDTNLKKCFYLLCKNNIIPFNIRLKFIMNINPIYNYYNINDLSNDYNNFLKNKISNLNQINKNLIFKPSKLSQINLNFLTKKNENDFYNNNIIKNDDKKIVMSFIKIILNIDQINIEKLNDFKVTLLKLKELCKNNLKQFLLNSETIKKINNINQNNLLKIIKFISNNNMNDIEFNKIKIISPVLSNIFFYIKELINFLSYKYKLNESISNINNELLKCKKFINQ